MRLLQHREERNKNRPELAAMLKKYGCTHEQYTLAYERVKNINPCKMFVNSSGLFVCPNAWYAESLIEDMNIDKVVSKYKNIIITPEQWNRLMDVAESKLADFPKVWAQVVEESTAVINKQSASEQLPKSIAMEMAYDIAA